MTTPLRPQGRSLPTGQPAARRLLITLILIVPLVGIAACQPAITVQPEFANSPLPVATVAPAERDLSVIGVDFDPPLEYSKILASGGINLLVAVTNSGQTSETNVQVSAQLHDASGLGRPLSLLSETITLKSLEPGAVEVVRFSQVTDLPVRPSYKLVVKVAPAPGETDLEDNTRTYEIMVDETR